MSARTAALAAVTLLGVAVVAACQDPTQIELEITTDLPCGPGTALETAILVGPANVDLARSDRAFVASTTVCTGGVIGSIVLVPSGSRDDELRVDVVAALEGQGAERCRRGGARCLVAAALPDTIASASDIADLQEEAAGPGKRSERK